MKLLTLHILIFATFNLFCQADTIHAVGKKRMYGKNYILSEQKIGFLIHGKMTFKWEVIYEYLIPIFDNTDSLYLKLYDKKNRLFAEGSWSDGSGFLECVKYYNRKGKVRKIKNFQHDQSE